jgi:hypothetical protein
MSKTAVSEKPCPNGHVGLRYAKTGRCVTCAKAQATAYSRRNREKVTAQERDRRQADPETFNIKRRAKYGDVQRTHARDYQRRNRRAAAERHRAWRKANPNKVAMIAARYRAAKLQAVPAWLTAEHWRQIREIYDTCPPGHHVDHIVPLQGREVCGLHVPWNLQHLTAAANWAKKNRLMPALQLP